MWKYFHSWRLIPSFLLDSEAALEKDAKTACRSGEIGRRSGLKIHRALARAGSIPAFGTRKAGVYRPIIAKPLGRFEESV